MAKISSPEVRGSHVIVPGATQVLGATSVIQPNSEVIPISSTSELTLTSAPGIADGTQGQVISVWNTGNFIITIPLSGTALVVLPNQVVPLFFLGTVWRTRPGNRARSILVTDNLLAGAIGNYSVNLARSFRLMRIESSSQARVRVYSTPVYRTADSARTVETDYIQGNGLISEVVFAGQLSYDLDNTTGSSMENPPTRATAVAVTNTGSTSAIIALTFTYLKLED
jgi:hypothetical protein